MDIGTGKSLLLKEMVRQLRERHGDDGVHVTASTGLAGCNISGSTVLQSNSSLLGSIHSFTKFLLFKLHSFAGVGLGEQSQDVLLGKVFHNKKAKDRWTTTKVLIVDEVVSLTFLFTKPSTSFFLSFPEHAGRYLL